MEESRDVCVIHKEVVLNVERKIWKRVFKILKFEKRKNRDQKIW